MWNEWRQELDGNRILILHTTQGTSPANKPLNKFGPQRKNLSSIIRGFKSAVTMNIRKINPNFGWQARFHDHIIRDEDSLVRIRNYIIHNPKNWTGDEFYLINT